MKVLATTPDDPSPVLTVDRNMIPTHPHQGTHTLPYPHPNTHRLKCIIKKVAREKRKSIKKNMSKELKEVRRAWDSSWVSCDEPKEMSASEEG